MVSSLTCVLIEELDNMNISDLSKRNVHLVSCVSKALSHQEKAVMSSERIQGIDHPQTIQDYVSLIF